MFERILGLDLLRGRKAGGVEEGERFCLTPLDQPLPGMQVRLSG